MTIFENCIVCVFPFPTCCSREAILTNGKLAITGVKLSKMFILVLAGNIWKYRTPKYSSTISVFAALLFFCFNLNLNLLSTSDNSQMLLFLEECNNMKSLEC